MYFVNLKKKVKKSKVYLLVDMDHPKGGPTVCYGVQLPLVCNCVDIRCVLDSTEIIRYL